MARTRKSASPPGCETLPVLHPEIGSLPLWCTMLFSLLLAALMEIFLLRAECARAKARLTTFEGLLKKSADFLRTTSENFSWPSSVMSSPVMMRGRRLLESINSALDPARGGRSPARTGRRRRRMSAARPAGKRPAGARHPARPAIQAHHRRAASRTRSETYISGNAPAAIAANSSGPESIPSSRCSSWRSGRL